MHLKPRNAAWLAQAVLLAILATDASLFAQTDSAFVIESLGGEQAPQPDFPRSVDLHGDDEERGNGDVVDGLVIRDPIGEHSMVEDSIVEDSIVVDRIDEDGFHFEALGMSITVGDVSDEFEDDDEDGDAGQPKVEFGDFLGYNSVQDDTTWLFGSGDDLGIFSLESFPTLDLTDSSSLVTGIGVHFLNGPIRTDLPPRLYDFQIAYHMRHALGERLVFDFKAGVGVFSDFEGSAREGVRNPGHAVGFFEIAPWLVSVGGLEVLDRDDYNLLPVGGVILRPAENLILEMVYPRPKVQFKHKPNRAIYVSGELGGDTWAIERAYAVNDVVTYKDLRILFGAISFNKRTDTSLELGWAFDRRLSYRSNQGNYQPDDAFLMQFRVHY
jgi:hypothetical protein